MIPQQHSDNSSHAAILDTMKIVTIIMVISPIVIPLLLLLLFSLYYNKDYDTNCYHNN